jgi:2-polyprenyl-3-methyl-5-hydroxy-6-metoxy-1,4-benzoquinol methylase
MKVELEHANCGFCGAEEYKTLYAAPEYSPFSQCYVVQCSNCDLVRTNPRPTQATLTEVYSSHYYSRQTPTLEGWSNKVKIFALKHNLEYIFPRRIPFKIPKKAVICDVGCGSGQCLGFMRVVYPDVVLHGFETDEETASTAAQFCGGHIRYGDFLNNGWSSNIFDFITFWDVLEHVANPKSVMQEVKRLLKPNGIVVVGLPNFDCLYSQVFNQFWSALMFDQHLYHFSQKTLGQLFQNCGLEIVKSQFCYIHPIVKENMVNLLKELEFKGESNTFRYVVLKNTTPVISLLDKLNISRLGSQHLLMCAKKPSP